MSDPATTLGQVPLSSEEARALSEALFSGLNSDGAEVLFAASNIGLTRYAGSKIIQNTARSEARAYVRVVVGDRVASAGTTRLTTEGLRETAERARSAAGASRPDPEFPGLPSPEAVGRPEAILRWDDATAAATPAARATRVSEILKASHPAGAAGIYETGGHAYAVFSTTGVDCYDAYTRCAATCLADVDGATGWDENSSHASDNVDVAAVATRAVFKARRGASAVDAEPGVYEVVLEEPAVKDLLEYLAYSGFGAKQVVEGESFLSTRAGKMVANPAITVADDVVHPRSVGIAFDFEGVPRHRVAVIDSGKATGPVTDLRTAALLGVGPTGHNAGSNEFGPYASNVVLEAGDSSLEDLVGPVDEGLLVTRFHYVNVLDRPSTLLTGMTRDGTFRIRNGEIAEPVHNLRFVQGALDALGAVRGVGRDLKAFAPEWGSFGSTVAPALRIGEFRFASRTTH
jgi:PmbA protein